MLQPLMAMLFIQLAYDRLYKLFKHFCWQSCIIMHIMGMVAVLVVSVNTREISCLRILALNINGTPSTFTRICWLLYLTTGATSAYVCVCVCVCSASSVKAFEVLSAAVAAASARLFSVCSKETNTVRKSFGDISETEYWNCFIFDQNFL